MQGLVWYNRVMAQIPTPDRGQPLDVSYIFTIANAINDLDSRVEASKNNFSQIAGQDTKTGNLRFFAQSIPVTSGIKSNEPREVTWNFPLSFAYIPVVTATPYNIGGNAAGGNVIATIKSITTHSVTCEVRFNKTDTETTVSLNIVAVGIPDAA